MSLFPPDTNRALYPPAPGSAPGAGNGQPPASGTRPTAPPHLVRRTRRRLLWWSLPVVLVVLVLAVKLLSLQTVTDQAKNDLDRGDYEGSIERSGSLLVANLFEPWIPYYNRGTAQATYQAFTPATDDLGEALTLAPASARCMIRVNLALAWEQQGDAYRGAGYEEGALRLYETSLAVLRDGAADGCQTTETPEATSQRDTLSEADARVQAKIDQQPPEQAPQSGDGSAGGTPDQNGDEGPSTEEKLQERGDQAAKDKAEQDAEQRGREGQGGGTDKPW